MQIDDYLAALGDLRIGRPIERYELLDSTNRLAAQVLREGRSQDGQVILADRQSRGRGTGGRSWISDRPEGLWVSLVLHGMPKPAPLAFWPALAIVDYLQEELGLDAHLKWPNDVLVGPRKIAGILVEVVERPASPASASADRGVVIGMGLNLGQSEFPAELGDRAISVHLAGVPAPAPLEALLGILRRMDRRLDEPGDLVPAALGRCRMIGRRIRYEFQGRRGAAHVRGFSPEGFLIVQPEGGPETRWVSGSAVVIDPDY